ncbi:glycerophosphodiester phosphodiesterase 1 [Thrips palmi]|uniref:Glycerophosphodiester phosphodiesterase 1 n=1 Tax=Thrips palmi TaxID=161013 RepID=A0A6P8YHZ6_THRPL|nr:glycerophosphodiester phosphodiesterase 1 [Thrips palmi]
MGNPIVDLFSACLTAWLVFYGALLLTFDLWPFFALSVGTVIPVLLFVAAWWLRVPPPAAEVVNEILGPDPVHGVPEKGKFLMRSVAHRGAPLDAPENSIVAFRMCAAKGCTAVELDVQLTKDEVPVVFHDTTVERLTGKQGVVSEMTWDELSKLDIAATHHLSDEFKGTRVARLDEAIKECLEHDLRIFIDLKDKDTKLVKVILDIFSKFPKLYSRAVVSGFNPLLIYMVRRANPGITCSLAFRPFWFTANQYSGEGGPIQTVPQPFGMPILLGVLDKINHWMLNHFTYYFLGLSAILLHNDIVSQEDLRRWRERHLRVVAWSANKPVEKKYFSKILKVTYMTDTMIGEPDTNSDEIIHG